MSILGRIFSRILPHHADATSQPAQAAPSVAQAPTRPATQPQAQPTPQASAPQQPIQQQPQPAAPATATMERVDVEKVLDGLAAKNPRS